MPLPGALDRLDARITAWMARRRVTLRRLALGIVFLWFGAIKPGTMMPLFLFPDECFRAFPYAPTLEGQYIIKNLVLVGAAIVIGATVRGGQLVSARGTRGN